MGKQKDGRGLGEPDGAPAIDGNEYFQLISRQLPRIGESLRMVWGSDQFDELVRNLLTDTRDGARRGFPLEIASALYRIAEDHELAFPQFYRDRPPLRDAIPKMIRETYWKRRTR